jgi:hypothetical protein
VRRFALVPAIALLALACQDEPLPTDGADPSPSPAASVQASTVGDIEDLIGELFPEPGLENAALTQFGNVERMVEEGDVDEARAKAFDLIGFTLEKLEEGQLEDPSGPTTTEEAVSDLIDLLLTFVGLEAPDVSPSVLSGDTDGVVAIAFPDQDNLIVTGNEFAGTFIPAGAVDEETVVVVERLDPVDQPGDDCLPIGAEQREGCYRFDKSPDDVFNEDVLVAVCPVASLRDENDPDFDERFQLAKFDPENPGDGVVPLPSASEDFLDCSDFGTLAAAVSQGPLGRLAGAWSATGGRLLRWLGPAPARAVNLGFGGSTRDFSRIGWARLGEVQIASGDGQTDFTGFRVDANPTVQVSPVHPSSGAGLEGMDVTFTVTQGGGTVDDPETTGDDRLNSVTVSTDANGQASVPWRLGSAGANALEASAGVDAVTLGATASAPQLPIQCTTGQLGDRVLNVAESPSAGRAFYVAGYPDTDLGQVDLWIAADNQVEGDPVSDDYTIELTVRAGGFAGTILGTAQTTVELSGDPGASTQVSFFFQIDGGITPGSTVTFDPVVTAGPAANVLMEVPASDADPQFGFPGDAACPIIETNDATAPLSTDRRQGVRANIFADAPVLE